MCCLFSETTVALTVFVPTQYSANRAHIGLCIQTVQLHSTNLTLTLDTLKLKDGVAATVPWRTFTSILDFYALLLLEL